MTKEISQDLVKLMLFSGRIPETHYKAIQSYPFIFFNGLEEAKLDYSISTNKIEPTIFKYDLKLNLDSNDHLDKRYKHLEQAIRAQFWKEVLIHILINGQEVYKSD